jgi:hypothetical protein
MRLASTCLIAILAGVPLGQVAWELASKRDVQVLDLAGPVTEARLRAFEDALHDASFLHTNVTPHYNRLLFDAFGRGNEKVVVGSDGWLFYAPDLDLHTQRAHNAERAAACVLDLRQQLGSVGVELVIVPVWPKSAAETQHLTGRSSHGLLESERASAAFLAALGEEHWGDVVFLGEDPSYLKQDTHWTPETVASTALTTASFVRARLDAAPLPYFEWERTLLAVEGQGDLVGMLHWPNGHGVFPLESVMVNPVRDLNAGTLFAPSRDGEVLLLGDSFSRIYSDSTLHFGEHAGFDAQLSAALGTAVDVIALPGGKARSSREALAKRGDALDGKRVVVWQFSLRDLVGDPSIWDPIDVLVRTKPVEPAQVPFTVEAELIELTPVPAPGTFDYPHLRTTNVWRTLTDAPGRPTGSTIYVLHEVMRDFNATEPADWAVGKRARLELDASEAHFNIETQSWLDEIDAGAELLVPLSVLGLD